MAISIHNIIETLDNPSGRFRSLEGLRPLADDNGEIVFSHNGKTADFLVMWHEERYMLKCCVQNQSIVQMPFNKLQTLVEKYSSEYLVDYKYFADEMLVFDVGGNVRYLDIVLMGYPEGETLEKFLIRVCDDENGRILRKLKEEFCRRGSWLLNSTLVHRKIRPNSILVSREGVPTLINYESMVEVTEGGNDESAMADNVSIAAITLVLNILRHNPALYRLFNRNNIFRLPIMKDGLLKAVEVAAETAGCKELVTIAGMLSGTDFSLSSPQALAVALDALARNDVPVKIDSERLAGSSRTCCEPVWLKMFTEREKSQKLNFNQYDFVGFYSEELICVLQHELWGYIDKTGETIIPFRYQWASDFAEGRAVVIQEDYHAMIDKKGEIILPAKYESIDWDCHNGIAKVMFDGLYGLYGRNGDEFVAPRYEWMGETMDDLILVKENGLFGYIRRNGEVVIPPCYEDASSFSRDGLATITQGGVGYVIDMSGKVVSDQVADQRNT